MASAPNGSYWEVRDDLDGRTLSPLISHHAYSNEALVDGDEYFSDHMEYEEATSQRRNRQRPLGASPVHRGHAAEVEQRRLMGKSMPQLNESGHSNSGPGRPVRQHRYEVIPPSSGPRPPPPAPPQAPLPPRPTKNQTPPPRQNSGTPPKRTPSNASQIRRQGSIPSRSAPSSSTSAMSHPKMAVFLQNSSVTPRRNLTPLMNSMSPQRHSSERWSTQRPQQINHRRSLSMSSKIKTTAIVAPSTYKSYDLEGLSYESPHRAQTELEADMAELHASLMASPSRCCRTAPKPIRKSPAMTAATSTSPLNIDSPSPASSKSWVRLPGGGGWAKKPSSGAVSRLLIVTGVLLLLCGLAAGIMCFYLLSQKGRTYYLDLGVLASFTSMLIGAFGLRARATGRIPNRNYITAYLLLTTFGILSVGGLVAIILAPPPTLIGINATVSGTPIVDIAGGAVCTTSAMTLLLTAVGMFLAYCSNYPPPDNRVASCSPGFRV